MGVDFIYESREAVDRAIREMIYAEADDASEERDWQTTEPFSFLDVPGANGRLIGSSKYVVSTPMFHGESGDADGRGDLQFLVDYLCRWSTAHGLTWELALVDQPVGTIKSGQPDLKLTTLLRLLGTFETDELARGLQDLDAIDKKPNDIDSEPQPTYIT